jgi:uncharacterized protein YecA (UPF0149 family)
VILLPGDYTKHNAHELLSAADQGLVGLDQRLIRAILAEPQGIARYAAEKSEGGTELVMDLLHLLCQAPSAEALPFLLSLASELRDDMPEELLEAFARLGAPALAGLLDLYEEDPEGAGDLPTAIAFLKTRDERAEAVFAAQGEVDAQFLREVAHGDSVVEPYNIYAHYPEESAPTLSGLNEKQRLEFLKSPELAHRLAALSTFLDTEVKPKAAEAILEVARQDENAEVRGVAWEALESRAAGNGKDDKKLRAEMRARLVDSAVAPAERAGLLVAFANREEAAFAPVAQELYADRATRARALQAMWRSFDKQFLSLASESLSDEDSEIREQAILATGYLGNAAEAPKIEKLFTDDELRDTALFAYALCAPMDVTRARAKQMFRTIDKLAGGLNIDEAETVENALDLRLEMNGLEPVFSEDEHDHDHGDGDHDHGDHDHAHHHHAEPLKVAAPDGIKPPGRNDPCPCGSGKKYKKCHGSVN